MNLNWKSDILCALWIKNHHQFRVIPDDLHRHFYLNLQTLFFDNHWKFLVATSPS